ncbi:coiled-coil domain-containing protein [Pseudobutyrivibrio xylanivorans]|uniref:Chromosome segregation ATPase n=1 Tax=Pseudobutyrivibrio xylanivorans DSM 14809 TaxID=1123012 RepID=A0A1M6G1L5_PSEXY|nr:hypothetical protein [Pseudobutyrivibrio xylanivorans]SHJ03767.1 hypothetical protein SAMN02745725_01644 [Pseudobutyrivibrio xylanivorans DSM 14809]
MKRFGRKLVRALFVSGTIAAGFAINSTSTLAAEVKDVDEQSLTTVENDAKEGQISENSLQTMEDATGVIEGDAVAEESYLNQAKDGVEKGNLTPDSATEIMNGGTAVMEQAQEKKETVDSIYETVTSETENAKTEFTEAANGYDLEDDAKKVEAAENTQDKISAVNNTVEDATDKHEEFSNSQGKDSQGYKDVCDEVTDCEEMVAQTQAEYDRLVEYGQELNEKYSELIERINNYEDESYRYNSELVNLREEISYANKELFGLSDEIIGQGKDYAQAIANLNEVMKELREAEARLEEAAAHLNDITADVNESEYSTDISAYEAELENFNNVSQRVNESSQELRNSKDHYQQLKNRYNTQTKAVEEKYKALVELQDQYNKWLAENNYEEMEAEYREVEGLISENNKATSKRARNLSMQQGYLNYLNGIKNGYDVKIASDYEHFNAVIDASNRYIAALMSEMEASELKDRADAGYTKTSECYEKLKDVIEAYNTSNTELTNDEIVKAIEEALKDIENDVTELEKDARQVKESLEDGSLTIGRADELKDKAASEIEDAQNKNAAIQACYEQLLKNVKEVVDNYNKATEYIAEHGVDSEEYRNLLAEISELEAKVSAYEEQYNFFLEGIEELDNSTEGWEYYNSLHEEAVGEIFALTDICCAIAGEISELEDTYNNLLSSTTPDENSLEAILDKLERLRAELKKYEALYEKYTEQEKESGEKLETLQDPHGLRDIYDSLYYNLYEVKQSLDSAKADLEKLYEKKNDLYYVLNGAEFEGIEDFYDIAEQYKVAQDYINRCDELVTIADNTLEKALCVYVSLVENLDVYYQDVVPVDVSYEFTNGTGKDGKTIKYSFIGKIKGNLEKAEAATTICGVFTYLKAASGTFTSVVSNEFGIIDTFTQYIDMRFR